MRKETECFRGLQAAPHLITQVETRPANRVDEAATADIHRALQARHLLSDEHQVDTAYIDAGLLNSSRSDNGVGADRS